MKFCLSLALILFPLFVCSQPKFESRCAQAVLELTARMGSTAFMDLLPLRYEQKVIGLKEAYGEYPYGTVTVANHPAMIDPPLLNRILRREMPHNLPRFVMLESEADHLFGKLAALSVNAILIPDPRKDSAAAQKVDKAIQLVIEALDRGENIVFYPSATLYRTHREKTGANILLSEILKRRPLVRLIGVRTQGLFGSMASYGYNGERPEPLNVILRGMLITASNLFMNPKRIVRHEFYKLNNFPRDKEVLVQNKYLDDFFNHHAQPNTYVPYSIWRDTPTVAKPDPVYAEEEIDLSAVPVDVREKLYSVIYRYLPGEYVQKFLLNDETEFNELGINSLKVAEIALEVEKVFPGKRVRLDGLFRVKHFYPFLVSTFIPPPVKLTKPVPQNFDSRRASKKGLPVIVPAGETILEVVKAQLAHRPSDIIMSDEVLGPFTKRRFEMASSMLAEVIAGIPDEKIGELFSAGVAPSLIHYALIKAGKIPFYLNPTKGLAPLETVRRTYGVGHLMTARPVVEKLKGATSELPSSFEEDIVWIEDMFNKISGGARFRHLLQYYFGKAKVKPRTPESVQAILTTSGTEGLPKAVAYQDKNLVAAVRSVVARLKESEDQSTVMLNVMPVFHVTGLVTGVLLPLMTGIPVIHHPSPHDIPYILELIRKWKPSLMVLTPLFLKNIVTQADKKTLSSIRTFVLGGDAMPMSLYEQLKIVAPQAEVLVVYGTTETTGAITINTPSDNDPTTLGRMIDGIKWRMVDSEQLKEGKLVDVPEGTPGKLLVAGDQIPTSYYQRNETKDSRGNPYYVEADGVIYNVSPDYIIHQKDGRFKFYCRDGSARKIAGELVSPDEIAKGLDDMLSSQDSAEPNYVVTWTGPKEQSQLLLVTTRKGLTLQEINKHLSKKGFSGVYLFAQPPLEVESLPLNAIKKVDLAKLKELIREHEYYVE